MDGRSVDVEVRLALYFILRRLVSDFLKGLLSLGLFVFDSLNGVGSLDFTPSRFELGRPLMLLLFLYSLLLSYLLLPHDLILLALREITAAKFCSGTTLLENLILVARALIYSMLVSWCMSLAFVLTVLHDARYTRKSSLFIVNVLLAQ